MLLNEYQHAATRTAAKYRDSTWEMMILALGLTGEAGEFANSVKKIVAHGHPTDKGGLVEELGDVLWYVAMAARNLDADLERVARANITKLLKRYPNGSSADRSISRKG